MSDLTLENSKFDDRGFENNFDGKPPCTSCSKPLIFIYGDLIMYINWVYVGCPGCGSILRNPLDFMPHHPRERQSMLRDSLNQWIKLKNLQKLESDRNSKMEIVLSSMDEYYRLRNEITINELLGAK